VAAGETLVRQGEPGDTFYLVVSGRMDVSRAPAGDGEEVHVVTLGPGDCFGEAALLSDQPRRATVRALGDGEVLQLARADFRPVIEQYQPVQAFFRELSLARFNVAPGQLLVLPDPVTTLLPRLRPSQAGRVLAGFGLGLVVLALLSFVSISSGWPPVVYLTLLVGGLLPPVAYVAYIRERDLLGDLPILLLLGVSAVAAAIGVPAAIYLENFADHLPLPPALLTALIEEPLKLAAVLWVMRHREYRFELDGVIFGITAAMGFGGLESLGYGALAYSQPLQLCLSIDGTGCMVQTLWLRIAAAFLGHGPWTAMICATLWRDRGRQANLLTRPVILTFLLAVILHTLWDTDPVVFGIPVAVVGILVLRFLMQEGLTHQAGALVSLTFGSVGDVVGQGEDSVRCPKCKKVFPVSHIYCVRCGLSLA
jgi:RsiW-degrading membrane proteinase PrsW (M82 family)